MFVDFFNYYFIAILQSDKFFILLVVHVLSPSLTMTVMTYVFWENYFFGNNNMKRIFHSAVALDNVYFLMI